MDDYLDKYERAAGPWNHRATMEMPDPTFLVHLSKDGSKRTVEALGPSVEFTLDGECSCGCAKGFQVYPGGRLCLSCGTKVDLDGKTVQ